MHARLNKPSWLAPLLLILVAFGCYWNSLHGVFQFDDYNVIVNATHVHSSAAWLAHLDRGIRPLLNLSYTVNWLMNDGVFSFHLTNLVIHAANTLLVFYLAQRYVQQQAQQAQLRWAPLATALLFASHPIHTEAVSYICGRSVSLMTLFYLAGLLCYVTGRTQQKKIYWAIATPLFFMLALSVKETAVIFPLTLLAWELTCGGRWQPQFKPLWPSCLVLLLAVMVFISSHSYWVHLQRSAELNSLQGNIATQLAAFSYLLKQWSLPLWLNIDPPLALLNDFSGSLLPLLLFLALGLLALLCWRQRPWISFAVAWAILQLIPLYLILPRIDIANERQMYLAGWPLLLALTIELSLRLNRTLLILVITVGALTLSGLTLQRNQAYLSEIALWEDTARFSPHKARVHNNLGYAYLLAHRYAEARRAFNTALSLDPQLYQARYNLIRTDEEDPAS